MLDTLPTVARIYVGSVIALAAGLVVALVPRANFDQPGLLALLIVVAGLTAGFKVGLPLSKSASSISVSYPVDFAALLLLGPHAGMLVGAVSAWTQCTFRMRERNPLHRTLFSIASLIVTMQGAGLVFGALGGVPGRLSSDPSALVPQIVATAAVYYLLNAGLVVGAIALSTEQSVGSVWKDLAWSAPSYFIGAAIAVAAQWAVLQGGQWMLLVATVPLYVTYRSYKGYLDRLEDERRHVQEMADLHLATIEALALAIDAKDQTAKSHIVRVQVYAAGLARALGMSDADMQGVKTAALLHDIGKLAVPEHILSKPGALSPEEFQKIRIHPKIGADIISTVPFPYPVAPLILNHHERWDGKGYPHGLKGEDIPLGARILAVVDYFDALTSDRPYHKAVTPEAALALLNQESGKAFDPSIVHLFTRMFPDLSREASAIEQTRRQPRRVSIQDRDRAGNALPAARSTTVFEDIAVAHREIYALYEVAQTMGTRIGVSGTMTQLAAKLNHLVPFTSCALFLYDEDAETLRCRFATGTETESLANMAMRSGQGLAGWVARNRRSLVNGRPSADFEAAAVAGRATTLQSALVTPLVHNERLVGVLAVYHTAPDFYSEDHRRLLERVAEQTGAVVHNSLVFEQTQEDSLTDALTNLPNTRFMFMHLTRELARAERLKSEVALLVMDLDNFKEINDTHGHHIGDRALREVSHLLRAAIRPYDICVRYAGDEFIVVLSGCGQDEAERKRVELQRVVDQATFDARTGRRIPLSISVGAAIYPHDGETYEELLATADSRMYRDKTRRKQQPRLQVVVGGEGRFAPLSSAPAEPSDAEIRRAGLGLL